jgi:hypothetical protein
MPGKTTRFGQFRCHSLYFVIGHAQPSSPSMVIERVCANAKQRRAGTKSTIGGIVTGKIDEPSHFWMEWGTQPISYDCHQFPPDHPARGLALSAVQPQLP